MQEEFCPLLLDSFLFFLWLVRELLNLINLSAVEEGFINLDEILYKYKKSSLKYQARDQMSFAKKLELRSFVNKPLNV